MECNKIKSEMLKQTVVIDTLENKVKTIEVIFSKEQIELKEKNEEISILKEENQLVKEKEELLNLHKKEFEDAINERNTYKEELARKYEDIKLQGKDLLPQRTKITNNEFTLSKEGEEELEEYSEFIKKAMGEIPSFTASNLINTFETPEALTQAISEKNYEYLLLQSLKVISTMLISEYSDFKNPPEETELETDINYEDLKEASPEAQPQLKFSRAQKLSPRFNDKIHTSINIHPYTGKASDKLNQFRTNSQERKRFRTTNEGTSMNNMYGGKPAFDNYTKKTTNYFDPLLQFGGESM